MFDEKRQIFLFIGIGVVLLLVLIFTPTPGGKSSITQPESKNILTGSGGTGRAFQSDIISQTQSGTRLLETNIQNSGIGFSFPDNTFVTGLRIVGIINNHAGTPLTLSVHSTDKKFEKTFSLIDATEPFEWTVPISKEEFSMLQKNRDMLLEIQEKNQAEFVDVKVVPLATYLQ